jgi:hypothetical protein
MFLYKAQQGDIPVQPSNLDFSSLVLLEPHLLQPSAASLGDICFWNREVCLVSWKEP